MLSGAGDAKSISTTEARDAEGSPSQSRSSSAQGSYSTSATTFEDADEGVPKSNSRPKETKGNVIVSVRVRPDVNGAETAKTPEWSVDGRHGLISYNGKEGGDYSFGKDILRILFGHSKVYVAYASLSR